MPIYISDTHALLWYLIITGAKIITFDKTVTSSGMAEVV